MTAATAFLLTVALAASPAPPPDPWFGEDKLKHFFTSFVVTSLSATGARAAGVGPETGLRIGVGIAGAAGLLKEVHDARRGGPFSIPDLTWNAAGIASGALLLQQAR
jgi:uncharacterized protein YfiM (DUF2279 family)